MNAVKRDVSVLIASTNAMASELMARALNKQPRFRVVAIVSTVKEVLDTVKSDALNVVLMRPNLADGPLSGFSALRQMRECSPEVKPIILLDNNDSRLIVDAFRAGGKGVLCPSQSDFKALCRCIIKVHEGQIWANSSELKEVLEAFCQLAPIRVVNADGMKLLTKREEDVVRLLAEGLQNREIARELNLSEHTVKNYLFHVFDKLGVSSRIELILYAVSTSKRMQLAGIDGGGKQEDEPDFVRDADEISRGAVA